MHTSCVDVDLHYNHARSVSTELHIMCTSAVCLHDLHTITTPSVSYSVLVAQKVDIICFFFFFFCVPRSCQIFSPVSRAKSAVCRSVSTGPQTSCGHPPDWAMSGVSQCRGWGRTAGCGWGIEGLCRMDIRLNGKFSWFLVGQRTTWTAAVSVLTHTDMCTPVVSALALLMQ